MVSGECIKKGVSMIRTYDLSKRYRERTALSHTTISFPARQFCVLLGPSGAGKSTLLRCLNHLTPPTAGVVEVEGIGRINTTGKLRELRRMTGFVFQQHQLILRQTALSNVLGGLLGSRPTWRSLLPWSSQEVAQGLSSLERVGLLDFALTRACKLSGGQQQRVGIARALVQRPRILLADEPVASLDPATSEEVLALLLRICREDSICAVVSLHQIDLAKRFADRVVALRNGAVVFDADPDQLDALALDSIYDSGKAQAAPREDDYPYTCGLDPLDPIEAEAAVTG
jgi:phosphonate transport system ATP-binding protein